jgi:hypothetical protein
VAPLISLEGCLTGTFMGSSDSRRNALKKLNISWWGPGFVPSPRRPVETTEYPEQF